MTDELIFIEGLKVDVKQFDNGGKIIKLGFKVDDFIKFAFEHQNESGWLNIDIKESQKGILYAALNTYKKEPN